MTILGKFWDLIMRSPDSLSYAEFSDSVADILENGEWIQGASARDADSQLIDHRNKKAVQFCAGGAAWSLRHKHRNNISVEDFSNWFDAFYEYLTQTEYYQKHCERFNKPHYSFDQKLTSWNDGRYQTKENVISAFRGFAEEQRSLEEQKYLHRRLK